MEKQSEVPKDFDNLMLEDNFYEHGINICRAVPLNKGTIVITFTNCLSVDILGVVTTLIENGYKFDYYEPPPPAKPKTVVFTLG